MEWPSLGSALLGRGGLQGVGYRTTRCREQDYTRGLMQTGVLTHRFCVQVSVGGVAARQSGMVGIVLAHVRGISDGHSVHRQLHQSDVPCGHVCGVPGKLSVIPHLMRIIDAGGSHRAGLLRCGPFF